MHPLELTELLNAWPPNNVTDWESHLNEWILLNEWVLAQGLRRVQWVLLCPSDAADYAFSKERASRLLKLVNIAHSFGTLVGIDVPIALQQQHSCHMVHSTKTALSDIRAALDFLMQSCGFDYLSTEMGTTEFTHSPDYDQLSWLNATVETIRNMHSGQEAFSKIHCSSHQKAEHYRDPLDPSKPCNFNFLPYYADHDLGVFPHTVELYSPDDPAPTYGNQNFGYMIDFAFLVAGTRKTVWHPETAYWIDYDINVPLFLPPAYSERRLHDMRLIARREMREGKTLDGGLYFHSGFEWGNWIADVVTARAFWNPFVEEENDDVALRRAFAPIVRPFMQFGIADDVAAALTDLARAQHDLLVLGKVGGVPPKNGNIFKRSGIAYLQGWDTWADMSALGATITGMNATETQPRKLSFLETYLNLPLPDNPSYSQEIRPLLAEMEERFLSSSKRFSALLSRVQPGTDASDIFGEICDGVEILHLRASLVYSLYEFITSRDEHLRRDLLYKVVNVMANATKIVQFRESRYRVPRERIAGWRLNPTSYKFGYLWHTRSLYFWWRDVGIALGYSKDWSPCFMNVISPVDVILGEGIVVDIFDFLQQILDHFKWSKDLIAECLAAPTNEPKLPSFPWPPISL